MSRFPKDCWDKNCPHFKYWDMSVDDLCCRCDLLQEECDACDEEYCNTICPMTQNINLFKCCFEFDN